jgi:hypothetical protein
MDRSQLVNFIRSEVGARRLSHHQRLKRGIALISRQGNHLFLDVIDVGEFLRDRDLWERDGDPSPLDLRVFPMRLIEMRVSDHMDECSRRVARELGQDMRQEGIGRNIEGDAQKHVSRSLVHLAIQKTSLSDIELTEHMARRKSHRIQIPGVPGAHHDPSGVWVGLEQVEDRLELIVALALIVRVAVRVGSPRVAPLETIDRS